jgi:hypothetical protein
MREILELATEKQIRKFLIMRNRVGDVSAGVEFRSQKEIDKEKFQQQRIDIDD